MRVRLAIGFVLLSVLLLPVAQSSVASAPDTQEWKFRVLLNDDEIGFHNFSLEESGGKRHLESNASFDVRFLFFTAYRYRHNNRETWEGSCLASIDTDTNANGDPVRVTGQREDDEFVVESGGDTLRLQGCVMSFAYWDPSILERSRLLNAQTGEYLDVDIEARAQELLTVRGKETPAERYRITARDMQIDLWYSEEKKWLALESLAKGGRVIRYELI